MLQELFKFFIMERNFQMSDSFYRVGGTIQPAGNYEDGKRFPGIVDLNTKMIERPHLNIDWSGINDLLDSYTSNATTTATIQAGLDSLIPSSQGTAKIWATPVPGNAFENLAGVTANGAITADGKFDISQFDNPGTYSIKPSNFPECTPGCLWYAMSIYKQSGMPSGQMGYMGTCYINFRQQRATGSNGLTELFSPMMLRPIEAFVTHGTASYGKPAGLSETFNDPRAGTYFSTDQRPTANGYHSTSKFSYNDGIWGYRELRALDGHGETGAFLAQVSSTYGGETFGIQNYASSDSTAHDIFWSGAFSMTYGDDNLRCFLWTVYE